MNPFDLAAIIIHHATNHKRITRDKEAMAVDMRLRKAAWDKHIKEGGEDIVKYIRPPTKRTFSTNSRSDFAEAFERASESVGHHFDGKFLKGNADSGYEVDKSSVAKYNKELRARMRAEKRSAIAEAKQAEEEQKYKHLIAAAERKRLEDLKASLECDSPAETDFLREVIATYKMRFSDGAFRGGGVTVRKQVEIGRYRVDFLFNEKLIVEIDGHEFHSGRDNANRDARRDETLRSKGYRLLRIPAYRVHHNPNAAVSDVDDFLKVT